MLRPRTRTSRNRPLLILVLPALLFALPSCRDTVGAGNPLNQSTLVFPRAARLGDTVALTISGNYGHFVMDPFEDYDLSKDNVTLEITDDNSVIHAITPRAVITGHLPPASNHALVEPGGWASIVVFDLPTGMTFNPLPASNVNVKVLIDGVESPVSAVLGIKWVMTILEGTGAPTYFFPQLAGLESRPKLRLRATDSTGDFFSGMTVGAIEFEVVYPDTLSAPDPIAVAEAGQAVAHVGPVVDEGGGFHSAKVLIVAPQGFSLALSSVLAPGLGEGPFVDIVFDDVTPFPGVGQFSIRNTYVTDTDGVVHFDERGQPGDDNDLYEFFVVSHDS